MLQTYRVETTISEKGILTVQGLPFQKGERVEVIILSRWVCAVAKGLDGAAFLITAYPTDAFKEGVEIWHR